MDAEDEYGKRMLATMVHVFDQVLVLNDRSTSYYFGTDGSTTFDREALLAAIQHPRRDKITVLLPDEAREIVRDTRIITINNMADLIYSEPSER
jgi:hypothetical protein